MLYYTYIDYTNILMKAVFLYLARYYYIFFQALLVAQDINSSAV